MTDRSPASQLRRIQLSESSVVVEDLTNGPPDNLRHYTAAHRNSQAVILGNGTHVSDIWADLESGISFEEAHREIAYEPDPPIYTPRITGIASLSADEATIFATAAAVPVPRQPGITQHRTLHIEAPSPGQANLVTTYRGDVDIPKPHGDPWAVPVESGWEALAPNLWDVLDPELRIAIAAFPLEGSDFRNGVVRNKNAQ